MPRKPSVPRRSQQGSKGLTPYNSDFKRLTDPAHKATASPGTSSLSSERWSADRSPFEQSERSTGPSRLLTGRRIFQLGPECETSNRIFPDPTFLQRNEKADYRKPDFPMGGQPISSAGRSSRLSGNLIASRVIPASLLRDAGHMSSCPASR